MLKVGSKFDTFDELSQHLEEFQKIERVQLWVRDSRTVIAAAKRARRKSLNPALKYAELTYSCVFGGRRPSDQTKVHNQTSAGGCPFKVRLSTSGDGQALIVKEICHNHNHEPGKKLHDEPRRLYKKTHHSRAAAATTAATTDAQENGAFSVQQQQAGGGTGTTNGLSRNTNNKQPIKLIVSKHRLNSAGSPFANLQQLQQQQQPQHVPPLKLHLHTTVHHQHSYVKKELPDQLTEVDIGPGPIPDVLNTPYHMYSMLDYHALNTPHAEATAFPFNNTPSSDSGLSSNSAGASLSNTPSSLSLSTTPSSSVPNTPNNSPDTSPTNSLSSGLDDPINFNMPLSPISPRLDEEEERNLEPIYDLSEYLEGGLASLPSVDSDDLPLCASGNRSFKGSVIQQQVRVATTTTGGIPCSGGAVTQLPVVRAQPATGAGTTTTLRLGFPSNCLLPFKSKTMASGSGNIYINTEGGLVKAIKTSGTSTVLTSGRSVGGVGGGTAAPSVHYNLVPNKLSSASGCKIAGKITIQQFLSGSSGTGKGGTLNTTCPNTTSASVVGGSGLNPQFIVGCNSSTGAGGSVVTGSAVSSSSCSNSNSYGIIGTPVTTVGCSLVNSAGPVRNYRAKIAKKPYGAVGGVLKVVRSDSISSPIEKTMDRLLNTVTPNKINFVEISNKLSGNKSLVFDHSQPLAPAVRNLFSGVGGDSSDDKSCLDLGSMDHHSSLLPEMDKVISGGGLDADIKIKTELAEGVPDHSNDAFHQPYTIDRLPGACIKEENPLDDEGNQSDCVDDLSNLFVLDGLEPSLGGDIPITPESYFSATDMDNYDFYMF